MHMVSFGNTHPLIKTNWPSHLLSEKRSYKLGVVLRGILDIISCFSFSSRDSQGFQDSLTELNLGVDVICHKPLNIENDNTSTSH